MLCAVALLVPRATSQCNATSPSSTSIQLTWTPTESTNGYLISYQSPDKTVSYSRTTQTTNLLTGLQPGTFYSITIQSEGSGGNSSATNCSGFTSEYELDSRQSIAITLRVSRERHQRRSSKRIAVEGSLRSDSVPATSWIHPSEPRERYVGNRCYRTPVNPITHVTQVSEFVVAKWYYVI